MKASSVGFVLITVLIFLQIFSLLGLYVLMRTSQLLKTSDHRWQSHLYQHQGDKILRYLEDPSIITATRCMVAITPSIELSTKALEWWQMHACSDNVNEVRYYYVMEYLGNDPCGIMEKSDNMQSSSKYYRITLYVLPDKLYGKLIMQSTVALPENKAVLCQDKRHSVQQGRQMWREI